MMFKKKKKIVMDPQEFLSKFPPRDLITLDLGNSHPHYARFKEGSLSEVQAYHHSNDQELSKKYNLPVHTCSVRRDSPSSFASLFHDGKFMEMNVQYGPTLGHDRLVTSYFVGQWLQEPFLLIDAGTFITIDLGDQSNFQGGFILPGLRTFSQSYQKGNQLHSPHGHSELLKLQEKVPHTTSEAIDSGLAHYLHSLIEKIENLSHGRKVIFSGGDANHFSPYLSGAMNIPHLIHYSLYFQYIKSH